ncbi:MAG: NADH-quinone oxidoreductase subunit H [Actinobacteria bacterium]|nr:NADH-quinone oxidoreductase subunit H [Actinomycetota bacterium]
MLGDTIFDVYWFQTVIKVLVVALLIPTTALILGIVFLFKVMSWMQSRLGPQEAGPKGLLQLLADGAKFLQKEDLTPMSADVRVFRMAPIVVLMSTFLLFVIIPASPNLVVENLPNGVFFAFAVSSLSVIGVLMAGWASANKYALLGGIRAAGQLIAYELPMVLAVVGVVIQAGTLSMNGIVVAQAGFHIGPIPVPYIVTQFPMFLVFLAATQAELTQAPFDMPVAESELVAGYQVEYSGFRFLFFFMAEFATAFAFAAIAATLFLGGYYVPGLDINSGIYWVLGPIVLFTKIMLVSFLIFWFRFTYPRFREDQLQRFAWKWLIPISLVWISVTALFKVWVA